jgi:hypothetical protein
MGIKNRWAMARDWQSRMEEDCIGSKGPDQAVELEKKKKIRGSHKNLKPVLLKCRKP